MELVVLPLLTTARALKVIMPRLFATRSLLSAARKMPLCPVGIACFFVCADRCAAAHNGSGT